jgi:hypothetical protein
LFRFPFAGGGSAAPTPQQLAQEEALLRATERFKAVNGAFLSFKKANEKRASGGAGAGVS